MTSVTQRTSSSASVASDKDEDAFYKRALHTAIDEFIQDFIPINDFDEASNNNNNEKENAPTAEDTPPTDAAVVVVQMAICEKQAPAEAATTPSEQGGGESATATAAAEKAMTSLKRAEAYAIARPIYYNGKECLVCLVGEALDGDGVFVVKLVGGDTITTTTATSASQPAPAPAPAIQVPIAAAKTRDVDALVQQLDEHINVTYTTGTALFNESGAVTSCCEQQLRATPAKIQPVATASSPARRLLTQVEKIEAATESSVAVAEVEVDHDIKSRGSTWFVVCLMAWIFYYVFAGGIYESAISVSPITSNGLTNFFV